MTMAAIPWETNRTVVLGLPNNVMEGFHVVMQVSKIIIGQVGRDQRNQWNSFTKALHSNHGSLDYFMTSIVYRRV